MITTAFFKTSIFQRILSVLFLATVFCFAACQQAPKQDKVKPKAQISFKSIIGIPFTEARRIFDSGLAFESHGFYQEPNWKFTFLSEDSVSIYSPIKKRFVVAPVTLDHDSVVNIAWAWLRVKKLTQDSIIFQVLKVENKAISHDGPFVFMKLYANSYITDKLHTSSVALQKPNHRDTAFIKQLTLQARSNPEKAFAAVQPVRLISRSPKVTVEKRQVKPDLATGTVAEESYFSPAYDVMIHKAYDDFSYSFIAAVDEKGKITFLKSLDMDYGDADFEKYSVRNIKGIIDGYLKYYLQVVPGSTLNIPHASSIVLNVNGIKD